MVESGLDESDDLKDSERIILIVDDSPMSLRLLTHMVTLHGYSAQPMISASEALTWAFASPPDLILLDIMMSEMSGFEFAERLKADERTRDIPIIFISALSDDTSKVKAFTSGGVDYVSKPLHLNEVIARVGTHIRLRDATQRLQRQITERERLIVQLDAVNEKLKQEIREREAAQEAREASLKLLQQVLTKTETLYRITRSLITSEGVPDMLQMVSDSVAQLLPADYVTTVILDTGAGEVTSCFVGGVGSDGWATPTYADLMEGLTGWAVEHLQPVISPRGQRDPRESVRARELREAARCGSTIVAPLYFRGRVMGAMTAARTACPDALDFDERDLAQLNAIAGQTSVALANAWLSDETARLKEFNEGIVQGVAEAMLLIDADGHVTFANPAAVAMMEKTLDHGAQTPGAQTPGAQTPGAQTPLEGMSYAALFPEDQHQILLQGALSRAGGMVTRFETALQCETGKRVPVLASIRPLYKDEQVVGGLVALTDITEIKLAEQKLRRYAEDLEAQNAELGAFAHTVAHDLRSPLTGIIGYVDLLEMVVGDTHDERLLKYVHYLQRSSAKMNSIIDELLLLASVREVDEVNLQHLDMATIVAESRNRLDYLIKERNAEVLAPTMWPEAVGYGPWIEEVWVNYLSNAVKYGGRPDQAAGTGVTPVIHLGFDEDCSEGRIRYWVQDNGAGLTDEQMAQLFTPFERLKNVSAEGHGLGLSIVRRILEKLGGEVGVMSELGKGSLFYFVLPRA
ncbi:MAG: response regulator [Anaerolineae bacterium]|jgi:signal transduction histidine kinase/DNA-binding response OmpR family regulator|nr:response regulator [Anaerolineae bacterium]